MQHQDYYAIKMRVEGWIGHFRNASAITSQTTRILPSKSATIGMLLAKIGWMRTSYSFFPNEYSELLSQVKLGIKFHHKTVEKYIDFTIFHKAKNFKNYPVRIEYVVFPRYELIYLLPKENEFFGEKIINNLLEKEEEHFKMFLGINECPLTLEEINEASTIEKLSSKNKICSSFTIPRKVVRSVDIKDLSGFTTTYTYTSPPPTSTQHKLVEEEMLVPLNKSITFYLKDESEIENWSLFKIDGEEVWLI